MSEQPKALQEPDPWGAGYEAGYAAGVAEHRAWREEAALGCDHCNQPLYAAIKCRVCGRVTQAKPVQEPVAWIHTDPDKRRVKFLEWRENEPGYRGDWIKTPLYAAPYQRKPLTKVDLRALYDQHAAYQEEGPEASGWWEFARAIERAHGIDGAPKERNFCPRCGKRLQAKSIHTCTPPGGSDEA